MTVTTERSTRDVKLRLRGRQPTTCGFWADFVAEMTCPRVGSWSHGLTEINGAPSWLKSINRVLLRTDGINAMRAGIWQPRRAFTQSRWNPRELERRPTDASTFPPNPHYKSRATTRNASRFAVIREERHLIHFGEDISGKPGIPFPFLTIPLRSVASLSTFCACPAGSPLSEPNPTHPACSTAEVVLK